MLKDLSEVERLRREVSFLRSAERESQKLIEAEVSGTLARKAGRPLRSNPHSRENLDLWTQWEIGWSNEDHIERIREVADAAMGMTAVLIERVRNGTATEEEKSLLASLSRYHLSRNRPDVYEEESLRSMP